MHLHSRLYATRIGEPCKAAVIAFDDEKTRFPVLEHLLDTSAQARIHSCIVEAHEGRRLHYFCAFFKWDVDLPVNKSLPGSKESALGFRGDALMAKVRRDSVRDVRRHEHGCGRVVGMRGRDTELSDIAIVQ